MNINSWPINERPREKLLSQGAKYLSDSELLAIFISTGTKGKTAVDLAREILLDCGNLHNLFEKSAEHLCSFKGLGLAKYAKLHAALELSKRYLMTSMQSRNVIDGKETAKAYFTSCLRNSEREVFACLFLDNQNGVIHYEELFSGTINKTVIYPREIIKKALQHNASAIILAHNHTSGATKPSKADKQVTAQLKQSLRSLEIRLLDHLIIGDQQCLSFRELGLL
jgi:DNA repair protein RadC